MDECLAWLDGGGALCAGFHSLVNGDVSLICLCLLIFINVSCFLFVVDQKIIG